MDAPSLNQIEEFRQILADYHISQRGKELLDRTPLVLLVSPSAAGRDTIINELLKSGRYQIMLSDTTRPRRTNNGLLEQSGVEYFFRSEEDIIEDLRQGKFLEAAIIHNQQVSGISLRELERVSQQDKIAINNIEVVGAENIHQTSTKPFLIFILPPSFEEWMHRLQHRGEMASDEIRNRLESAERELQMAVSKDYYRYVINDDLSQAVESIRDIVENGRYDDIQHQASLDLAWKLLGILKHELYS